MTKFFVDESKQTKLKFWLYRILHLVLSCVGIRLSLHCDQCSATVPIDWSSFKKHQSQCH